MKKSLLFCFALLAMGQSACHAWEKMRMPELYVKGRYLMAKDINGNDSIVNLHGFAQTYSPYFNGYAWCKNSDGSVNWGKTYDTDACVKWNEELIQKMLDGGWKVNWIRIHMDPHWTNTPGVSVTGENDISAFSLDRLKTYLDKVYIPMAEYAISHGIYVVMRPPGVCPEKLAVGDDYQKYLIKVWTYVCAHAKLKNNPYVMFELANEPINMNDGSGNYTSWSDGSQKQCTKFFQNIVDAIRNMGCNNILWVPGLAYQQNYQGYEKYPIAGENIGYAVHCYPGWYGSDSEVESVEQKVTTNGHGYMEFLEGWTSNISGIAKNSPILVTEMDWAPKKYNSSWGKATTGTLGGVGFGANFKYIMDKTGNVSWLLFTDADKLAQYNDATADGATFLTDPEACPRPVYRWYKEYSDTSWQFDASIGQHIEDSIKAEKAATAWYFPGTETDFDANIWETGSLTKNADGSHTIVTGKYGFGGWKFSSGMDISQYKYLVVNLTSAPTSGNWSLRLFDVNNYWDKPSMTDVKNVQTVVNLQSMKNENNATVDPSHIYILGFWSLGGAQLNVKSIYLTNNSDYSAGIEETENDKLKIENTGIYNLQGQHVVSTQKRKIYIVNGKKFINN